MLMSYQYETGSFSSFACYINTIIIMNAKPSRHPICCNDFIFRFIYDSFNRNESCNAMLFNPDALPLLLLMFDVDVDVDVDVAWVIHEESVFFLFYEIESFVSYLTKPISFYCPVT